MYRTFSFVSLQLRHERAARLILDSPDVSLEDMLLINAPYRKNIKQAEQVHRIFYHFHCCNQNELPVLLIMTSNAPDSLYRGLLQNYQQTLNRFVGPTEVFVSGDTLQLRDYSKLDWEWSMFDPEAKRLRHETIFPQECRKAYELGEALANKTKEA